MTQIQALDPSAEVSLEGMAVGVHEAGYERPTREPLSLGGGADVDYAAVLVSDSDVTSNPVGSEY